MTQTIVLFIIQQATCCMFWRYLSTTLDKFPKDCIHKVQHFVHEVKCEVECDIANHTERADEKLHLIDEIGHLMQDVEKVKYGIN